MVCRSTGNHYRISFWRTSSLVCLSGVDGLYRSAGNAPLLPQQFSPPSRASSRQTKFLSEPVAGLPAVGALYPSPWTGEYIVTTAQQKSPSVNRRDLHQEVTDTIIQQLEKGIVPWHQPWRTPDAGMGIPSNYTTDNYYRGVNILLLWTSVAKNQFCTHEWASLKQWNEKKEFVRKGEKGTRIIYYNTVEKEVDGEIEEIPFIKASTVFNRCQLVSFTPASMEDSPQADLVTRVKKADTFIANTGADIGHHVGKAYFTPMEDKILMPYPEFFIETPECTATEGYYSTLLHELTHWTGHPKRLNRKFGKEKGDKDYATEELVGELGAAFLCAEHDITVLKTGEHANYIAYWLDVLKSNKKCIFAAASQASKACDYLHSLQPR
jgi:antirestriction protein ArdC